MNKTDIAKAAGITLLIITAIFLIVLGLVKWPKYRLIAFIAVILIVPITTVVLAIAEDLAATRKRKEKRKAKGEISLEHLTSAEWYELANEKSVAISQNGKRYIIIIPASIDIELDNYTTNDLIITEIRK